jgi:hypothetical protein
MAQDASIGGKRRAGGTSIQKLLVTLAAVAIDGHCASALDMQIPGGTGNPHIAIDSTWSGNSLGVRYADFAATLAPFGGLYENGVRFRLGGNWVGYNFVYSSAPRTLAWGDALQGNFQIGYGLSTERIAAIALIGLATTDEQDASIRTSKVGGIGTLTVNARPSESTFLYASAQYLTSTQTYYAQAKAGVKAIGQSYLGIEGSLQGLVTNSRSLVAQQTIGGHISNIPVGPLSLSFSAGYVRDNDLSGGIYVASSLYFAF